MSFEQERVELYVDYLKKLRAHLCIGKGSMSEGSLDKIRQEAINILTALDVDVCDVDEAEAQPESSVELFEYIEIDRDKCSGVPMLKGTRFPIARILAEMTECVDYKEVAEDYNLESEDVKNALGEIAIMFDQKWVR